jgi:hypothetical protein
MTEGSSLGWLDEEGTIEGSSLGIPDKDGASEG